MLIINTIFDLITADAPKKHNGYFCIVLLEYVMNFQLSVNLVAPIHNQYELIVWVQINNVEPNQLPSDEAS